MWISSGNNSWKVKNTKTVKKICPHCGNTSQQYVMGELSGLNLGFIFMPAKTRIGKRNYYLVCSICNKASKELTRVEFDHLKNSDFE